MEVSTSSNFPQVSLTSEAIRVIQNILNLEGVQLNNKYVLYKMLKDLWEGNGLVTISYARNQFNNSRAFIKAAIFDSLPAKKQKRIKYDETIYKTLKNGTPFKTSENEVIPSSVDEVSRFKKRYENTLEQMNYRFRKLVKEFEHYLTNNDENILDSNYYKALKGPQKNRESFSRTAKSKSRFEDFIGMELSSLSNSKGKKRRTIIKKVPADHYYEVKYKFIYYAWIKLILYFRNSKYGII